MKKKLNSIHSFFACFAIGFLVSSFKINLYHVPNAQIIEALYTTILYNFVIGIFSGISGLFMVDFYYYLKQKRKL